MKKFDMHVHSKFSFDNDADPEEMILAAVERGLDGIVFTEHDTYEGSEPVELLKEKYSKYITSPSRHGILSAIKPYFGLWNKGGLEISCRGTRGRIHRGSLVDWRYCNPCSSL